MAVRSYGTCGACGWEILNRNGVCHNPNCPTKTPPPPPPDETE